MRRSVITRTGPASRTIGVGASSVDGLIATESRRVIAGKKVDSGPEAEVAVAVVGSVFDDDKGTLADSPAAGIAALDSSGLLSPAITSAALLVVGNEEFMGEVVGIETSLRRPLCNVEAAPPVLCKASMLLISTGIVSCACDGCDEWSICDVP